MIFGQLRFTLSTTEIIDNAAEYDRFLEKAASNIEKEIRKLGLKLISIRL